MKSRTLLSAAVVLTGFALDLPTAQGASLLHHWKLDGDATDSVGSDDGTEEGGATYTTGGGGQFGEAVSLDGVDDAIRTGSNPVPATDYTLTAWVFWEAGNTHRGSIAGGQKSGSEGEVFTMSRATDPNATDRKLFLNLLPNAGSSITESPDNTVSTNVWQHVAYSVSSTAGVTLYLNGAVVATNPALTTHTPSSLDNFTIGARPDSTTANPGWFDGLIDDVAIFDGVLDSTQLADVISLGAENFDASTVDVTPPELSTTDPVGGATDVLRSGNLVASFNETVQAGTAGTITLRKTSPDELVEPFDVTTSTQLTFSGPTVTIDPSIDLIGGVEYYVLIDAGAIEDAAGNDHAGLAAIPPDSAAWSFTTDGTPPTGSGMGPMAGATDVLPSADLTLAFDEDVMIGTGNITIHLAGDGSVVQTIDVTGGAVTIDGAEVTIDIADLALDTPYYVNIAGGAFTDLSGNAYAGINDNGTWAFRTVATTLIHHWEFEGDASDSAGSHDGMLNGDATFAAGVIGQAAKLDGDGDFIATNASSLPPSNFTLTAWVNPNSVEGFNYVAGTQQSANFGAFLRLDDGVAFVNLLPPAASKRASGGTVPLSTWTHLAFTVDDTAGLTVFVNGSSVASDPEGTGHSVYDNFTIGTRPDGGTFGFDGLIDDLRIYAEVLSESEIAALAAGGGPPLVLKISQNGGNLDFQWNSMDGMQYDLVSSEDLLTDPATWLPYDDAVNPVHENIPANGTTTNLTGVVKVGTTRFFALIEEQIPPLFSENFDGATGVPTGWIPADNAAGTVWQVDDPSPGPAEGPDAAASGANCAGTNITAFYKENADVTLTSPAIAIPAGGATLRFQQYIDTDLSGDLGSVRLLDADNADTEITEGDFPLTSIEGVEAGWTARSLLFPTAALGKNVKIRFHFVSDADTDVFSGFYVDDVEITAN